jgi:uncharacterized protein YbjT (DUF2867 family)
VHSAENVKYLRPLGAEPVVGDVTKPNALAPVVEDYSGVYSVLAVEPGRGAPDTLE